MAELDRVPESAPQSCTLPTEDRPLRLAEWDALFATQVTAPSWPDPLRLRLELSAGAESQERTRDLAARESECCSFFGFTVAVTPTAVVLDIAVDQEHEAVLHAMAARAVEAAAPRDTQ